MEWLDLFANRITDFGASSIAKSLHSNSSLQELWLGSQIYGGNCIGPRGCTAIAESLRWNAILCGLNLSWNPIGDRGAIALARSLSDLSVGQGLKRLWLAECGFGWEGEKALATLVLDGKEIQRQEKVCLEFEKELKELGIMTRRQSKQANYIPQLSKEPIKSEVEGRNVLEVLKEETENEKTDMNDFELKTITESSKDERDVEMKENGLNQTEESDESDEETIGSTHRPEMEVFGLRKIRIPR